MVTHTHSNMVIITSAEDMAAVIIGGDIRQQVDNGEDYPKYKSM